MDEDISKAVGDYSRTVKIASLPDASQKVGTSCPELYVDQMENSLKEVSSYPLMIVAISGKFRSGESFALHLMTDYLKCLEEDNQESWINSGVERKGVQCAGSSKGIWMWRKPFVLTRSDGSKVAIILFDCQGTGDVSSSLYLDTLIAYISLQLSNVQIINLRNQMKADDLTRLEMCTDYADHQPDAESDDTDESDQHIFDRLIYLLRNGPADDQLGERDQAEITNMIEAETTSHEVKKASRGIKKAFRKVSVYALPHPGKNHNIRVKEGEIDPEYLKAAKEMFDRILLDEAEDRHLPLASEVLDEFKLLGERIAKADLSVGSPAASLHETLAYKAFLASRGFFEKTMNREFQMQGQDSISTEEIEQKMNDLWGRVEDHYKRGYKFDKFGETDAYRRYWEMLEKQRERLAEVIKAAQEKEERFAKLMAEEEEKRKADQDRIREEANQKVRKQLEAAKREYEQREEQRAQEEKKRLDQQEESLKQAEQARINAEKKQREEAERFRRKLEEEKAKAAAEKEESLKQAEQARINAEKKQREEAERFRRKLEEEKAKAAAEKEESLKQAEQARINAEKKQREEAERFRRKLEEEKAKAAAEKEESLKQAEQARINAEKKQREEAERFRRKLEEEKAKAAAEKEESLKQAEQARINAEKKQREEAERFRRKLEEEKAKAAAEAQRLADKLKVQKEATEAALRKLASDKDMEHKKKLQEMKRRQDEERQKEKRELMKKEADAQQARADAERKRKLAAAAGDSENEAIESTMFMKGCRNLGSGAVDLVSGVGQLVASPFVGLWKAFF